MCGERLWDRVRAMVTPGSPSLEPFRGYEQQPSTAGDVTARFLGTTSVLFQDAATAIMSDGFVTRPGLARVVFGRIGPDRERIQDAAKRLEVDSIAAVFTGHSHYDHALDAPTLAQLTGAVLLGSQSTFNIGLGAGLPESAMHVVRDGETMRFGRFELTFLESEHSRPDVHPGTVKAPLVPPARSGEWKNGGTYSVLIRHEHRTILMHGSSNFKASALRDHRADVVYLGIGGLGKKPDAFVDAYWDEVVGATRARRVILVHWDNFFHSLDEPLRPMPNVMGSFSGAMQHVLRRAAAHHVEVLLPVPWQRTDPFAGLA
jgi:L-ascorbate metabolism protein UlaG (beta-lactamase superfamily)